MWLAPTQVVVMPITDKFIAYAEGVTEKLKAEGLRVELDARNEKIGYKIREAQGDKVPYMLIVGEREEASGEVSVRHRKEGDIGSIALPAFVERCKREVRDKVMD